MLNPKNESPKHKSAAQRCRLRITPKIIMAIVKNEATPKKT
jgi:hypothetical protein